MIYLCFLHVDPFFISFSYIRLSNHISPITIKMYAGSLDNSAAKAHPFDVYVTQLINKIIIFYSYSFTHAGGINVVN